MAQDDFADSGGIFDQLAADEPETTATPTTEGAGELDFLAPYLEAEDGYAALEAQGDNPSADEPSNAGFWSGIVGGTVGSFNSAVGVPAMVINEGVNALAQEHFPDTAFSQWTQEAEDNQEARVNSRTAFQQSLPHTKTLSNLMKADSTEEFFDTYMESDEKWNTFKELVGVVIPGSAAFAGGAALQGLKGAFGASMMLDWGDSYQQARADGQDKDEAMGTATVKSLTQAGVDTLTLSAAKLRFSTNAYKDMMVQTGIQAGGGAFAEYAKHAIVGEEAKTGAMWIEGIGEAIGAPVDVFAIRSNEAKVAEYNEGLTELRDQIQAVVKDSTFSSLKKDLEHTIGGLEERLATEAKDTTEQTDPGLELEKGQTATSVLQDPNTDAHIVGYDAIGLDIQAKILTEDGQGIQKISEVDWETTPVVVAQENEIRPRLMKAQAELATLQSQIENQAILQEANPEQMAEMQNEAETYQVIVADLQIQYDNEIKIMDKSAKLIGEFAAKFAPDMKIVVSPGQLSAIVSQQRVDAVQRFEDHTGYDTKEKYQTALHDAKRLDIKSSEAMDTRGLFYKTDQGVTIIELDASQLVNRDSVISEADFVEVVTHEFGHALISEVYLKSSQVARKALTQGYKKWLNKLVATKTADEFWQVHGGAARASQSNSQDPFISSDPYWYSMNEYLANQLAKSIGSNKLIGTPVEGFFKRAIKALRELFAVSKDAMPEQSFTDFVNLIAAKETMVQLEKAEQAADVATMEQVYETTATNIGAILDSSQLIPRGPEKKESISKYGEEEFRGDLDKYNGFMKWSFNLLQMGKRNPHIVGLKKYVDLIKGWWNEKSIETARGQERLEQWYKFKPKHQQAIGTFMQDLTVKSYDNSARYGPESDVFKKLVEKHNMTDEMIAFTDLVAQDFEAVLMKLQQVQIEDLNRTMTDEGLKATAIAEIEQNFTEMRERNFFPLSRFGEQFMRVKAHKDMVYDGVEYTKGDTLTFETFETQKEMLKRQKTFANGDKYIVEGGKMNDHQKQFAGFPPQLLSALRASVVQTQEQIDRIADSTAQFQAQQQKDNFEQLVLDMAPGRSFTKHMMHRKNTPGYSTDAIRSYANYFLHFGNYVARIKYKGVLSDAINEVGKSATIIGQRTGDGTKRTDIQQYMQHHFDHAMNPGNELANLRAVGFLWYLGFSVKSAAVNLTQVPLVTYPYLAARFGDVSAVASLAKATKDAGKYWMNPKAMTEGQLEMINELVESGILDESLATELAAASEGSLLQRVAPGNLLGSEKAARTVRQMAGAGAWLFTQAEKMNRRVTSLAAYDLTRKAGGTHEEGVLSARDAVETTQYEYARWNRPRFTEGKKSIMFMFWQYMQNSLFFLAYDPGRLRYAAMMLLMAGISGFPFAEDMADIYDYIAKKLNKKYGEDFAPANIRLATKEFIGELGMNPDLMMHGASRYSFGLSSLADMIGAPFPNTDMSGSLGMGSIIPGVSALLGDQRFDAGIGRAAEDLGGAVVAMPIQLFRAVADNNPDTLKRFERAMPVFARNVSKAYRFASRGEETLPDGSIVTQFDITDNMHRMEIAAQSLGFAPTRVNEAKAPHYMTKEILRYYALRRQSLTEVIDYAKRTGDSKMLSGAWKEVLKYNKGVQAKGLGSMSIKAGSIRRSLKERIKQRRMHEQGFVGGRSGAQVSQEVYDAFESIEDVP